MCVRTCQFPLSRKPSIKKSARQEIILRTSAGKIVIPNMKAVLSIYLVILSFSAAPVADSVRILRERFRWRILDFAYPSPEERSEAIATGRFIPENNLPVGFEIWKDMLFVTVPRWKPGVPATLNYVPLKYSTPVSPALIPYPNWPSNELGNCENGLNTVYRIHVDVCDRLWVLDTGTFGIEENTTNLCPYALNIFDLRTHSRLRRYQLRPEDTNPNTFMANIAVDVGETCEDAFAYMSDELGYGLVVYSWEQERSWRFTHGFFMPDPLAGDFNIGGLNFQWSQEGIFGLSLSPTTRNRFKILFFSPLASNHQFGVSTRILRNSSRVDDSYHDFIHLGDRGPNGHTTARVMDDIGVEFFNLIDRNAIGCWNSAYPYHRAYLDVIDKDDEGLVFPSDVKIDSGRNLWVMSDRMPNFLLSTLNYMDVNFRLFYAPIDIFTRCYVRGQKCNNNN